MTAFKNKQNGFTLIEVVIIIAILAVMLFIVGNTLAIMIRSFNSVGRTRALTGSVSSGLERLAREARSASNINASSVLGVDPSTLVLDSTQNGVATTFTFKVNNGVLLINQAGVTASLTPGAIHIDSFIVKQITTGVAKAVKIDVTASDTNGDPLEIQLHDTIILRGSY